MVERKTCETVFLTTGSVEPSTGSAECARCPPGSYSDTEGSKVCLLCEAGFGSEDIRGYQRISSCFSLLWERRAEEFKLSLSRAGRSGGVVATSSKNCCWNFLRKHVSCDRLVCFFQPRIFPQIAIAIGVLTSNRGGGRRTTLADWTWHQGAIAGCNGRGATAGCHRRVPLNVLWLGGRVTTNLGEWT